MIKSVTNKRFYVAFLSIFTVLITSPGYAVSYTAELGNFEIEGYAALTGLFSDSNLNEDDFGAFTSAGVSYGTGSAGVQGTMGFGPGVANGFTIDATLYGGTANASSTSMYALTGAGINSVLDYPGSPYSIGIHADTEPAGTLFDVTVSVDIAGSLTANGSSSFLSSSAATASSSWNVSANGTTLVNSGRYISAGGSVTAPESATEDFTDSNSISFIAADGDVFDIYMLFAIGGQGDGGASITTDLFFDGLITVSATPVSAIPVPPAAWLLITGIIGLVVTGIHKKI